jgi:site-specific recombinase XerD
MYGAALRISEALSLKIGAVDLANGVLTIRDSKFFKTRLVPIGPKTGEVLREYVKRREDLVRSTRPDDPFFLDRNGKPVPVHKLERAFKQIREHAGLHRQGGPRCQPRLHDLRHRADSPIMPNVAKGIRLPAVWRGVPCLTDRWKSA